MPGDLEMHTHLLAVAMDTFADAARAAKFEERAAGDNLHAAHDGRKRASKALMAAGCDLLAVEGAKHRGEELSPHLKVHLDRVAANLDHHIDSGPVMVDKRRAVMARALPYVGKQEKAEISDAALAQELNAPGRSLQLRNRLVTSPTSEKAFSGVPQRGFDGAEARSLLTALNDLQKSLNVHSQTMTSVFALAQADRDLPVSNHRAPPLHGDKTPARDRLWESPVSGSDRGDVSIGSRPPPMGGIKRSRSFDSDDAMLAPAKRRGLADASEIKIREDDDARIMRTPPNTPTSVDDGIHPNRHRWVLEDLDLNIVPTVTRPVDGLARMNDRIEIERHVSRESSMGPNDDNAENVPPESHNRGGRSRDDPFGL